MSSLFTFLLVLALVYAARDQQPEDRAKKPKPKPNKPKPKPTTTTQPQPEHFNPLPSDARQECYDCLAALASVCGRDCFTGDNDIECFSCVFEHNPSCLPACGFPAASTQFCSEPNFCPNSGLPTVYSQPAGEIELKKDNLLATVDIGRQWEVAFDFMPENYDADDWTSILHLTIGGDVKTLGDRTPAIMWHPNYGLTVATAIGSNSNFWDDTKKSSPPVGKWSRIVASQRTLDSTTYMSLEIDGIPSFAPVKNPAPMEFSSVKVYASDNWTPTQPGSIRGLVIKTK